MPESLRKAASPARARARLCVSVSVREREREGSLTCQISRVVVEKQIDVVRLLSDSVNSVVGAADSGRPEAHWVGERAPIRALKHDRVRAACSRERIM